MTKCKSVALTSLVLFACGAEAQDEELLGEDYDNGEILAEEVNAQCASRPDWRSTITLDDGYWGSYAACPELCPRGSFAYALNLKSESYQGSGDDTAVNAVSLQCRDRATNAFTGYVESNMGPWGSWRLFAYTDCSQLTYPPPPGQPLPFDFRPPISGGNLRVEPPQGSGDDTGATGIKIAFECGWFGTREVEAETAPNTRWGSYRGTKTCGVGRAVCGINTRLEGNQGSGDDTTLNGVRFECCQLCPAGQEACSDGVCRPLNTCPY